MSEEDKGHGPGRGEISPEEREAIRQRSSDIGKKLDAIKAARAPAGDAETRRQQSAYGKAFSFAAELIVGVVLGGLLGWALDRQFGKAPIFMVLCVTLGFAASLLNIVRAAKKAEAENEDLQRSAPSVPDDEDDDK
jgi:ATP synthase protein I